MIPLSKLISLLPHWLTPASILGELRRVSNYWSILIISALIGILTGFLVSITETVVYHMLFLTLYNHLFKNSWVVILIPMIGVLMTRVILLQGGIDGMGGTEEVVKSYHEFRGKIRLSSVLYKIPAYICTLGFGGSAGMEGISTYIGGAVSSLSSRILSLLNVTAEDQRVLLLAGAGAGLSAMFKAPLTGAIFMLQVPFRGDLAPNALLPTVVASVASYLAMVSVKGTAPLFTMAAKTQFHTRDLIVAILIGSLCGILARLFLKAYRTTKVWFLSGPAVLSWKNFLAASILGMTGFVAQKHFGEALPLGPGYSFIQHLLSNHETFSNLLLLLLLKTMAIIFTFSAGGMGGSFFPLLCLGAATGGLIANIGSLEPFDFGVVMGMSSFLAAGYKTPLASVVFIAESTHSSAYLIPGLMATVFAYVTSGATSISSHQRDREDIHLSRRFHLKVLQAMSKTVIVVPAGITIGQFRENFLMRYFHRTYPVLSKNGSLVGIVSVQDVEKIQVGDWEKEIIDSVMVTKVITVRESDTIQDAIGRMNRHDLDFIPVVSDLDPQKVVGGLSRTDIFQGEWASRL